MHLLAVAVEVSIAFCLHYVYVNVAMFVCVFAVEIVICLCVIFMQIARAEWFLGVQIQNFENIHNAEYVLGTNQYCCCDTFEKCTGNIADLQGICMAHSCQTYFLIHISSCDGMCSYDKTYQLSYESSTSFLDHAVLSIPFKEMKWTDHVVRTKICYIMKSRAKFRQIKHA